MKRGRNDGRRGCAAAGRWLWRTVCAAAIVGAAVWAAAAEASGAPAMRDGRGGLAERAGRVLLLRDYNTRVVLLGTSLLGATGGVVGTFMLLRKRALLGDVVSHCALPGIGIAFLVGEALRPGSGKALPGLLVGALAAGIAGSVCVWLIRRYTRIKEDAALACVLSIFFGVGIALFTVIQNIPSGGAAGLNQYIFGKAASLVADDVKLIALAGVVVLGAALLLMKEMALVCFDEQFAAAQGWPVGLIDLLLVAQAVGVTIIGLQSVGLLLVVAMLIIPAAAARFWTDRLTPMTVISGALGGLSALGGAVISALAPRLAAGAVIVLVGTAAFLFSLVFGLRRGIVRRAWLQWSVEGRVAREHLLRGMYEAVEEGSGKLAVGDARLWGTSVPVERLAGMRSWSEGRLRRLLARQTREGMVCRAGDGYRLTEVGAAEAARLVRNHRLWELYLIQYADVAPSRVDRDADLIEHVLDAALVAELERQAAAGQPPQAVPASPHALDTAAAPTAD